ncbi:hypothetical protein QBC33DRAFT_562058 [Phialemonium atrogriseum]|uniref:Uncharacterized protein n=1 Tax=Phialemonium atrogriseum TaxID=1093897 RepID=A0AAJ0BYB3_9PEZI|nr:uncharacterized protein QBC33DRAFT_562058 [Phialemonium atrogriseum]KAK1764316.1 hypothetical protein QBC33DRAFT_562058 [Phialemonium atrogriseum]
MPASKDVCYLLNVVGFAGSVADIATNSEIAKIPFLSFDRGNVGDGLPDWVEEEDGVWRWSLLVKRKENTGDLDDVKTIARTEERARSYLHLSGASAMVMECAKALREKLK